MRGHHLFPKARGVKLDNVSVGLVIRGISDGAKCSTNRIEKSLTFPLVKREHYEGWN